MRLDRPHDLAKRAADVGSIGFYTNLEQEYWVVVVPVSTHSLSDLVLALLVVAEGDT
jgi:hypothetical protein